jgi:DNA polymerase-3 subunit gamma/tau
MVLVRLAYAADLPTPDEVIRSLDGNTSAPGARTAGNGGAASRPNTPSASAPRFDSPRGAPRAALAPAAQPADNPVRRVVQAAPSAAAPTIGSFEELIALAAQKRDLGVKLALERDVRLVRCEDGRLEIALEPSAAKTLVNELSRKLLQWTGRQWMVIVSAETAHQTVKSQNEARQAELKTGVRADPLVQAVLARFPGAEIVGVRRPEPAAPLPTGEPEDVPEPPPVDDGSVYGADWRPDGQDDNL